MEGYTFASCLVPKCLTTVIFLQLLLGRKMAHRFDAPIKCGAPPFKLGSFFFSLADWTSNVFVQLTVP
jgi:hypothetical protein